MNWMSQIEIKMVLAQVDKIRHVFSDDSYIYINKLNQIDVRRIILESKGIYLLDVTDINVMNFNRV